MADLDEARTDVSSRKQVRFPCVTPNFEAFDNGGDSVKPDRDERFFVFFFEARIGQQSSSSPVILPFPHVMILGFLLGSPKRLGIGGIVDMSRISTCATPRTLFPR